MSSKDFKGLLWWERYFAVDGDWERNGGREQTQIFARHFVAHASLPRDRAFSLLDVGCALGDALEVFAAEFPMAHLHGLDFSSVAVSRARSVLGERACIAVGDLDSVDGHFDAIYCSNTLEHFADFEQRARRLLLHCDRLYVMVPFRELRDGKPLHPDPAEHHQHTFDLDSFDRLMRDGVATAISRSVFACPGAWGWTVAQHAVQLLKNCGRAALGRHWIAAPRQILYTITGAPAASA